MEVHFCQCDEKKDPVSHYNEILSEYIDLVSQNDDLVSICESTSKVVFNDGIHKP